MYKRFCCFNPSETNMWRVMLYEPGYHFFVTFMQFISTFFGKSNSVQGYQCLCQRCPYLVRVTDALYCTLSVPYYVTRVNCKMEGTGAYAANMTHILTIVHASDSYNVDTLHLLHTILFLMLHEPYRSFLCGCVFVTRLGAFFFSCAFFGSSSL